MWAREEQATSAAANAAAAALRTLTCGSGHTRSRQLVHLWNHVGEKPLARLERAVAAWLHAYCAAGVDDENVGGGGH